MSTNNDNISILTQNFNKSILNHLFLPYFLPSSENEDYLIQDNHRKEDELIKYVLEFFNSIDNGIKLPVLSAVLDCFQRWLHIQGQQSVTASHFKIAIEDLKVGGLLPLYFHAQNAVILIEVDHNINQPLISAWQVLLPTEAITASPTPHYSCFPTQTYRLSNRKQLTSEVHCELIADFMKNTVEYSKTNKAKHNFDEIRDIPLAHYVYEWWIVQFQGIEINNNLEKCGKFKKKHRDHIRWHNALKPFRRSGLWMTIKVILQMILSRYLGVHGHIVYKLMITSLLTYTICKQSIETDLLVFCIRKILRRLNKIEVRFPFTEANKLTEWIHLMKNDIKLKIHQIFPKYNPLNSTKIIADKNEAHSQIIHQHLCRDLPSPLNGKTSNRSSHNIFARTTTSSNMTNNDKNGLHYIPCINDLMNETEYPIDVILFRVEIWMKDQLEKWLNVASSSNLSTKYFGRLLNFFEEYGKCACDHYRLGKPLTNPIGYSRFILTSLTIIYVMHKKLCSDKRFERLKSHKIYIPNLIMLFEYLTLPNHEDMVQARQLFDYFTEYNKKVYPDLLDNIDQSNAFGVYFARQSNSMNETLKEIRNIAECDKQLKRDEVEKAKRTYEQLITQAANLVCKCADYCYPRSCERCSLEAQAESITVEIYECPIPDEYESALAVIFELQMPTEIRCYRDIVWQFINRFTSASGNNYFEWLRVQPHSKKLSPFYIGPTNCKVKLISKTKSITQSHYSKPPSIASASVGEFICSNGLKVQISPTEPTKAEDECRMLTPNLENPDYKHLQDTLTSTEFLQNRVIAELSNCPSRIKHMQHVEFGSYRSGHRLQLWNLLSVLETYSLPIDEEDVLILIFHSLWQYGPLRTDTKHLKCFWCPESHRQLLEDHFIDEMIMRLKIRLEKCHLNWQNELVLLLVVAVAMRILDICNAECEEQVVNLVFFCRQIGEKWIESIFETCQNIPTTDLASVAMLREKLVTISFTCVLTFSIHSSRLNLVLSHDNHMVGLLKYMTTFHDNVLLNQNSISSTFKKHMMEMSQRVLVKIQPAIANFLQQSFYRCLTKFSSIYWATLRNKDSLNLQWNKRKMDAYDGWYDTNYESSVISIDCIRGIFLVNGMTIGILPKEITSNVLYTRVFQDHIFEVQASEFHNAYITKYGYHGQQVHYEFHFDSQTGQLRVYEKYSSNEIFQLIPETCFQEELPNAFTSNYSHWRNMKTEEILFRPVYFKDKEFLTNISYVFETKTGFITTRNSSQEQILINKSSHFFQNLFQNYFSRLDDETYVFMLRNMSPEIQQGSHVLRSNDIIHIHLSRLRIAFLYNGMENKIFSREYGDMLIEDDQDFGAFMGLKSCLLLSSSSNHPDTQNYRCRKLLVPYGKVVATAIENIVTIIRSSTFSGQYFTFTFNDRLRILQATDSPRGSLYLALLHAMTSHSLPDEYTGMTGMERAFQLLNSASCSNDQPYDELSMEILKQIANISPKVDYYPTQLTCMEQIIWKKNSLPYSMQHFGYYLIVKRLIYSSTQFNFMWSKLEENAPLDIKNNEILLRKLYWDYRDSYNPTARLSEEMEAQINYSCSSNIYSLIKKENYFEQSYVPTRLVDSLYKNGDILGLKDDHDLKCFPLSKWLNDEHQLKSIWIGLLKLVTKIKGLSTSLRQIEIERFELLLEFLFYISSNNSNHRYYLQMLKTACMEGSSSFQSLSYPEFIDYKNIDDISVKENAIILPKKIKSSMRPRALAEIRECFDNETTYVNHSFPERTVNRLEINRLLKSWRSNKCLSLFLSEVENRFSTLSIVSLVKKIHVVHQHFSCESFDGHYQIRFNLSNPFINDELLNRAKNKFNCENTEEYVEQKLSTKTKNKLLIDEIIPSTDIKVNPFSQLAKHFKDRLSESWSKFQSMEKYNNRHMSRQTIKRMLNATRHESTEIWNELVQSIISSNQLLFESGLMLRIVPTVLISILQRILFSPGANVLLSLTTDQCILLGGIMVNWVLEQHFERALYFINQNKNDDFEKEMLNPPHSNWIPSKFVPWLIMELEMNITIRKIQVEVARQMMQPDTMKKDSNINNIVMQMNMGEGKTSVIIPMLVLALSESSATLVRLIVLKSLFSMNYQSLRQKLGGLLNRRVLPFMFRRNMGLENKQVNQLYYRFKQALDNLDIIITSPEDVLSFDLFVIEKSLRENFNLSRSLVSLQRWIKRFVRDILDESDEILHVKYQLVYAIGGQKQIDGGVNRWKTIQFVLQSIKIFAEEISKEYREYVSYAPTKQSSRFSEFRLLSDSPYKELCKKIANYWLNENNYRKEERELISNFIVDSKVAMDHINKRFPESCIQSFLILRGILSYETLLVALKKRYRVNFGVNLDSSCNRLMAVPFRAKDVVAEKIEFGHIDLAIILTQLSYYYSGLTDSQLLQCFHRLHEYESDPEPIYSEWISHEDKINPSIRSWKNVNLKDYNQRTTYLFPTLRYNMSVINYFLNYFVYPHEAKQFPEKLVSSAWDICSPLRSKAITGFSGTNDTQLVLPVHIRQLDLAGLEQTDAIVIDSILKAENENYSSLPHHATTEEILKCILDGKPFTQVILDVGALFIDGTNREIAIQWLKYSDKSKIDHAIYIESDSIAVCDREFHYYPFSISPAHERLDRCIIYLDEIHTRGTDFKFPNGFHAAVTLGIGLTKDRFVQACMRMRKLGHQHSLSFWSSNDVDREIRKLSKSPDAINLIDIFCWIYENTQRAIWDAFHYWGTQSLSYQRKLAAFKEFNWEDHEQVFTDEMMKSAAYCCKESETIELRKTYGLPKMMRTLLEIYETRYNALHIPSSTEIHRQVLAQLAKYSGRKTRLEHLLDEEQERELEQELEEQRQYDKPPIVDPCSPIFHKEIKLLFNSLGTKMNLLNFENVFLPISKAFISTTLFSECQANSWPQSLWISSEFQRVIETKGQSLNPFLRPPRWVIFYRGKDIIFISPFEANLIINCEHQHPMKTTLRLLLPRLNKDQSILVNTLTLTIPSLFRLKNLVCFDTIPIEQLVALFIFNGTLYFDDAHEQNTYCKVLGLCPRPRTQVEEDAFEKGWISTDGFVERSEHRLRLSLNQCRFTSNPIEFVRKLIEIRNNCRAPLTSHVGNILFNVTKETQWNE